MNKDPTTASKELLSKERLSKELLKFANTQWIA